jgi:hypothetical protein
MTLGEIYDAEERKRMFFFMFELVSFYGSGDTWFATSILADPPAGLITGDYHDCPDLGRKAPGGRARIGLSWVLRAMRKYDAPPSGTNGEG